MSVVATWQVRATSGVESMWAVAMPVTRFVAPGLGVVRQTPTLPVVGHSRLRHRPKRSKKGGA